jgi:hypothetical protein
MGNLLTTPLPISLTETEILLFDLLPDELIYLGSFDVYIKRYNFFKFLSPQDIFNKLTLRISKIYDTYVNNIHKGIEDNFVSFGEATIHCINGTYEAWLHLHKSGRTIKRKYSSWKVLWDTLELQDKNLLLKSSGYPLITKGIVN